MAFDSIRVISSVFIDNVINAIIEDKIKVDDFEFIKAIDRYRYFLILCHFRHFDFCGIFVKIFLDEILPSAIL